MVYVLQKGIAFSSIFPAGRSLLLLLWVMATRAINLAFHLAWGEGIKKDVVTRQQKVLGGRDCSDAFSSYPDENGFVNERFLNQKGF